MGLRRDKPPLSGPTGTSNKGFNQESEQARETFSPEKGLRGAASDCRLARIFIPVYVGSDMALPHAGLLLRTAWLDLSLVRRPTRATTSARALSCRRRVLGV